MANTKANAKGCTHRKEPALKPASPEGCTDYVAVAAYFKAERRGFAPGEELLDWLEAERELTDMRAD